MTYQWPNGFKLIMRHYNVHIRVKSISAPLTFSRVNILTNLLIRTYYGIYQSYIINITRLGNGSYQLLSWPLLSMQQIIS